MDIAPGGPPMPRVRAREVAVHLPDLAVLENAGEDSEALAAPRFQDAGH